MNNKRTKRGARAALLSGLAIILFIALNIGLAKLPKSLFEIDITSNELYSISGQSKDFLSELDHDIEIIVVARGGVIDERLSKLMRSYASYSPRITLRELDPAINPAVLDTYETQDGTVVVRCDKTDKTEIISIAGFKNYSEGMMLFDYAAYSQAGVMMPVALDAEGQLTAAIGRVTGAPGPKVYITEGHGETALGQMASAQLSKLSVAPEPVNLLKTGLVPADCELLICVSPASDLADDELTMLSMYLKNGGKLLLLVNNPELPGFNALLAQYGLQIQPGFIADAERFYESYFAYYGYSCIYPVLSTSSDVTRGITEDALVFMARGMTQTEPERAGVTVTPFMQTSEKGLNYVDENTMYESQYMLGAVATEGAGERGIARLTVITAASLVDDDILSSVPGASNLDIFTNAVTANLSGSAATVIPQKSMMIEYNTPRNSGPWGAFFIGFMPLAFIICGLSVWLTRRKR